MLATIKNLWGSFVRLFVFAAFCNILKAKNSYPSSTWPKFFPSQTYYILNYTAGTKTNISASVYPF